MLRSLAGLAASVALGGLALTPSWFGLSLNPPAVMAQTDNRATSRVAYESYNAVIRRTVGMVSDRAAQAIADQFGLDILNLTWEDTGRFYNSAVGPNISDMTIQVQQRNPRNGEYELHLMPVIRHPNFTDLTADVPLDRLFVLVGNERGAAELERVSLREVLGNLRDYLSEPESWAGSATSLLAERDSHVLVSAQACFLPIPQGGTAEFNPVLFNYQSYAGDPAVLTILATREGSSITVIDNQRDGFAAGQTWGQRLFFNAAGDRASLTGQRLSEFQAESASGPEASAAAADEAGLNLVMLIQVPLKQKYPQRYAEAEDSLMMAAPLAGVARGESDVEAAVIGHGEIEGPFTEIDGLAIERDPDFPIRVTVQFYKATSNGVVSEADLRAIRDQIDRVYADADYTGSLVVGGGSDRPTEYDGPKEEPPGWWDAFWQRHEANTGQSRAEALRMLRRLRGQDWQPASEADLQRALERLEEDRSE